MEASTVEEMQSLPEKTPTPKAEGNGEIPWLLACVLQCSPSGEPCQNCWGAWEMWSVGKRHGIEAESNYAEVSQELGAQLDVCAEASLH